MADSRFIIETLRTIAPLRDEWVVMDSRAAELSASGVLDPFNYTFYQTLPWNEAVERYYASNRLSSRLEYLTVRRDNRELLAILPLRITGFFSKKVEMTAWRTAGVNNLVTTVCGEESEEIAKELADYMAIRYKGHRLRLFDMPPETPFIHALEKVTGVQAKPRNSYHIPLDNFENFDAYYASLSKKLRHNIQTRSNHFTHGDLSWELREYDKDSAPTREEWLRIWRIFYARKLEWNSKTGNLFRKLGCEWQARREVGSGLRVCTFGSLPESRLCVFEINGEPAAFTFYYVGPDGRIVVPKLAIDSRFRTHAPGILMLRELLRRCYERGFRDFDLCRGDEPYKQQMGAVCRQIVRFSANL